MAQLEIQPTRSRLTADNWQPTYENGNLTGYALVDNDGKTISTVSTSVGPQYVGPETVANPFGRDNPNSYEMNWGENNAMEEIFKRGRKSDGTWNIGWVQGVMGNNITQQQMDDYATSKTYNVLASTHDSRLKELGLNPVSFGETETSVLRRLNQAENKDETARVEAARVEGEKKQELALANADIDKGNDTSTALQIDERDRQDRKTEAEKTRAFEIGMQGLRNDAETRRYEQQLAQWERQNRRESIGALIAGLATMGAGFAI